MRSLVSMARSIPTSSLTSMCSRTVRGNQSFMSNDKLTFCVFGAGRIGKLHARNVAKHPQARVKYVVDPIGKAAAELAGQLDAETAPDAATALADPEIDAVVIASSTNTHVDL